MEVLILKRLSSLCCATFCGMNPRADLLVGDFPGTPDPLRTRDVAASSKTTGLKTGHYIAGLKPGLYKRRAAQTRPTNPKMAT